MKKTNQTPPLPKEDLSIKEFEKIYAPSETSIIIKQKLYSVYGKRIRMFEIHGATRVPIYAPFIEGVRIFEPYYKIIPENLKLFTNKKNAINHKLNVAYKEKKMKDKEQK